MNPSKILLTFIATALTTAMAGCSASMVNAPGAAIVENAPVNEVDRPGVVRYLNEGVPAVRERRRASAYRQMSEACGGRYRIDAEGPRTEGGVVVALDPATAVSASTQYWYIQFSCVR